MKKSVITAPLASLLALLMLAGCGNGSSQSSSEAPTPSESASVTESSGDEVASEPATSSETTLAVGASPAPHAEILELVSPILAEQGITLEIKVFNDYIVPNTALEDGSLDANFFQHLPYLEDFNTKNGTHLVNAGGIHIEPLGIYPGRKATLEELEEGGVLIGIPNDTTNEGRALSLLETLGYIKLSEDAGLEAVPSDIVENPLNLKFMELEAAQLPVTLADLDFAIINGNYAVAADIGKSVLSAEGAESPYVNVVAVREGDESRPEIQALLAAMTSEEVRSFMEETYGGVVVPVF